MNFYKAAIRPLLFSQDPETSHRTVLKLAPLCRLPVISNCIESLFHFDDPRLHLRLFGLDFSSPIWFAAGIDKNAQAVELLASFGCGALEVGVVSASPQTGNDRPRVYRFPSAHALVNRMGNPNIGAEAAARNLAQVRTKNVAPKIGLNIGKTTVVPLDNALADYLSTFRALYAYCDYFVLNVSCPNVADYAKLQEKDRLLELFSGLVAANNLKKPILVKLSPDLTPAQIDDALECALECGISGIIATNTTTQRDILPEAASFQGGLSGVPLFPRALETVRYVAARLQGKLPIIGVGGIFTAQNVIEMLQAGASAIELYTALVYEGPGLVKTLKRDLISQMDKDGVRSISEYTKASLSR